ncbi:hypothetical protein Taro_040820, partial [Colocasia esculenta]|nr:hypothetical protein [Colocasia esculenta]
LLSPAAAAAAGAPRRVATAAGATARCRRCSSLSLYYTLPMNVEDDEDDDDDDDPDPEFTAATHASRRSYAKEDERRRGLGTSGAHLSRDDSRRSLPRSTSVRRVAGALRSRSVKQPGIKQTLKGVKATAKAAKGAIKGYFFNPKIQYKDNVHNDGEVTRGTMNVITRLARTMTKRLDAMAEVERYKLKLEIYGGYDMTYAAQRLTPAARWIQVNYQQAGTNPLTYVAVRVLSQTTSSSPC